MLTARLEIRLPEESDRDRFVELFCDEEFMVFSGGALDTAAAHERFDGMLERASEFVFAKQPLIERSTGTLIGYSGVNTFTFEGQRRLEWGWRVVPAARGTGYATEATEAILARANETFTGEILCMIDPANEASQRVAAKVGFEFWKQAMIDGFVDNLYRIQIGQ